MGREEKGRGYAFAVNFISNVEMPYYWMHNSPPQRLKIVPDISYTR